MFAIRRGEISESLRGLRTSSGTRLWQARPSATNSQTLAMRFTGKLRTWNDERGFGFIAPTHGGREVFVHASALPRDGTRPTVGETLTYEVGEGKDGKPQAMKVYREAFGVPQPQRPRRAPARPARRSRRFIGRFATVALIVTAAAYAYNRLGTGSAFHLPQPLAAPAPARAPAASSAAASTDFYCDGRKYCSEMTSCNEARFFNRNCPGTKMDGDGDGIPCEMQWCTAQ